MNNIERIVRYVHCAAKVGPLRWPLASSALSLIIRPPLHTARPDSANLENDHGPASDRGPEKFLFAELADCRP